MTCGSATLCYSTPWSRGGYTECVLHRVCIYGLQPDDRLALVAFSSTAAVRRPRFPDLTPMIDALNVAYAIHHLEFGRALGR